MLGLPRDLLLPRRSTGYGDIPKSLESCAALTLRSPNSLAGHSILGLNNPFHKVSTNGQLVHRNKALGHLSQEREDGVVPSGLFKEVARVYDRMKSRRCACGEFICVQAHSVGMCSWSRLAGTPP